MQIKKILWASDGSIALESYACARTMSEISKRIGAESAAAPPAFADNAGRIFTGIVTIQSFRKKYFELVAEETIVPDWLRMLVSRTSQYFSICLRADTRLFTSRPVRLGTCGVEQLRYSPLIDHH